MEKTLTSSKSRQFACVNMDDTNVGTSDGIRVWRIVKMKLEPVPLTNFGQFYNGDCYVILRTIGTPARSWNVHFWLGKNASSDEICAAAAEAVNLDNRLGGKAVQYRETQGFESQQFLAYFRHGIRYLEGGVDTALKHVPDNTEMKLYHVKGAKNIRVQQVPLSIKSLNKGDVFILDAVDKVFVWNGPESNNREKIKGAEMARDIRAERGYKTTLEIIDSEWNSHGAFYRALGSSPGMPIHEGIVDNDNEQEKEVRRTRLFRVSDASGQLEVKEIGPPFDHSNLDTNDCFFLDLNQEIFVWIGRKCTEREKKEVWNTVNKYLKDRKDERNIRVTKINEGMENALFKVALNWPASTPRQDIGISNRGIAKLQSADTIVLPELRQGEGSRYQPDEGKGFKQVWKVEHFNLVEVPKEEHGIFYSGDSYVILYKSEQVTNGIVYFWLGWTSSTDEKSSAAILATQIDAKMCAGRAVQVRVVQTKEPKHFLSMFDNLVITLTGGAASGFRSRKEKDTYDTDGTRLFQIKNNSVAQIEESAAALNSNDVFLLQTPSKDYMWLGKGSSTLEKAVAVDCTKRLGLRTPLTLQEEGRETPDFWNALGGKKPYATGMSFIKNESRTALLFHCSNARGYFHTEHIPDFSQADLEPNDVMILDTFDEIFVWVGEGANEIEKKKSLSFALKYISSELGGRRQVDDTAMFVVKQGYEPLNFTGHFPSWDPQYWTVNYNYERLKRQITVDAPVVTLKEAMKKYEKTYPVETLRQPTDALPEGVDPIHKERHLNDTDFNRVFGISREHFNMLTPWKQSDAKKAVGLF